jgi:3-deoxy-7-phosphoheptulonate synthase
LRKTITIGSDLQIGDGEFVVMAGPCAVESSELLFAAADAVAEAGAGLLRGGAFKPRTSPKSFQGLGAEGLALLAAASRRTGLPVVTEVMDPRDVELVAEHAAVLQVGSRNMQNFPLLREVGRLGKPVLLKRGAAATIDELLFAADYVLDEGNQDVILCERGVRSFDPSTRYLLDLAAVPVLQERTPLPVVVDPSHGTGAARYVAPMARAALCAGADGLLIEVHAEPDKALCDGQQALTPAMFASLMAELQQLAPLCQRTIRSGRAVSGSTTSGSTTSSSHTPSSNPTSAELSAPGRSVGQGDSAGSNSFTTR